MADKEQARIERTEAKREDRLEREQDALAKGADRADRADAPMVYEVLVDSFGAADQYHKGDLFTQAEAPAAYDLEWALRLGSIREAPEYRGSGLRSTTQPVEGQPFVAPPPPAEA